MKSFTPKLSSRIEMCRLTAPCVTQSSLAAAVKLPCRATASNARSAFSDGSLCVVIPRNSALKSSMAPSLSSPAAETHIKPEMIASINLTPLVMVTHVGDSQRDEFSEAIAYRPPNMADGWRQSPTIGCELRMIEIAAFFHAPAIVTR